MIFFKDEPEDLKKVNRMFSCIRSIFVKPGEVPPNPMFHLRRFAHISDSCINCCQCEELCAMDIPLALFSHAIRVETDAAFEPKLGKATYTN